MADLFLKKESKNENCCYVMLTKDKKPICRTQCINPPGKMPSYWSILNMVRCEKIHLPPGLPCCTLLPAAENSQQKKEWTEFLRFLQIHNKVAIGKLELYDFYIFPPKEEMNFNHITVFYKEGKRRNINDSREKGGQGMLNYLFSTLLFCDEMVLIAAGVLSGPKALHANAETYGFLESDMQLPESKPELVKGEEALSCSGVMGDRISRDS